MAGYKFQDSDNMALLVEPGDHIIEVVGYEFTLSKVGGHQQIKLKVTNVDPATLEVIPGKSAKWQDILTLSEKALWRADTFLKSCGANVAKGADIEFDPDERDREGAVFVDLRGLRGWALVGHRADDKNPAKKYNEVVTWYTNKPKVKRRDYPPLPAKGEAEIPVDPSTGKKLF